MKKIISYLIAVLLFGTALLPAISTYAASNDRLSLSAESNLTLIRGNTYITGICGTVTADSLKGEFASDVTLTSPSGVSLSGESLVPSDTVVSNGTESMKILIYGDVDRNGKLTLSDVSSMMKYISKWSVDICEEAIDLNWDEKKNLTDVSLLLKRIAGWNVCIGVDIVPNQITLSYFDSDCTKIGVLWHSNRKTHNPAVQVAEGVTDNFSGARLIYGDTNIGSGDNNSRAVIDGLEFGKTYSYRVGDASGYWSDPASFTVREETPEKFTFVCFTDSQSKDSDPGECLNDAWKNALSAYPETELALHCGDIVETVGTASWSSMLDTSSEYFRQIPTMVVSGNHETSYAGSQGYKMQYNHFFTDMPEQESYNSGYFYSFNYGDVHFVMLNTNMQGTDDGSLSEEQFSWLSADLEKNTSKWTVVLMHHPMYSTERFEDSMAAALKAQLAPLFAKHGVDIVLAGHDHIYYCTHPIDGDNSVLADSPNETVDGAVYYTNPAGVIYSTPGCTGSSARSASDTHPEYYRCTDDKMTKSYLSVEVDTDRLTVNLCIPSAFGEAEILDSWGIIKQ